MDAAFWLLVVVGAFAWAVYRVARGFVAGGPVEPGEDEPKPAPELDVCDRCGRKVAALEYHRNRCQGSSRPFKHSEVVKTFRRRERKDRT
jgi:hypothetical protein